MPLLTINSGSSSLKFGLYTDDGAHPLLSGSIENIGQPTASIHVTDSAGADLAREGAAIPAQPAAIAALSRQLSLHNHAPLRAIGHRIVHGGPHLVGHCALTPEVLVTLRASVHFAPLHIPPALSLIEATEREFPGIPQFACFDTQFHTTLPAEAYTYPIPELYRAAGIRRYGFHGLSYESIVRQLGPQLAPRTVVAHLGGGSSLCALLNGRSVDTSMGLSPCGGVPMSTRSGDLDPGVDLLLARGLPPSLPALTPDDLEALLNRRSGMAALANETDMRSLTQRAAAGDPAAGLALAIYTRDIAKTIAAYATVLGGLDLLVFTGGIGEHSTPVHTEICSRLTHLGLALLPPSEIPTEPGLLSTPESRVTVRSLATDENGQIALHVAHLLA